MIVNSPLIRKSIENGAACRELADRSQISEERQSILMLKIEEMESKKLKNLEFSVQSEQADPEQKRECLREN